MCLFVLAKAGKTQSSYAGNRSSEEYITKTQESAEARCIASDIFTLWSHFRCFALTINMGMVRMRVRHPNGTLQVQVEDSWTAVQLLEHLRSETGIQHFSLKEGFPPKTLNLNDPGTTLSSLGLNGSAITLTPADPPAETADQVFSLRALEAKPDNLSVRWPEMDGCMGKKHGQRGKPKPPVTQTAHLS